MRRRRQRELLWVMFVDLSERVTKLELRIEALREALGELKDVKR